MNSFWGTLWFCQLNYIVKQWYQQVCFPQLVVADVLKRKQEDGGPDASKKVRLDIPLEEQMLMATIPYHSVSYQEQVTT